MGSKLLLVEADASAGADLRAALTEAGYSVTLVRDGQLGLARAVSEHFDGIVVSADLPGVNGFRLCNRIRKDPNVSSVRVFIVAAEPEDVEAHAGLPTHADSYFEKPLVVAELIARMRLHGVGDAPAGALRAEIANARKDLEIIAELQRRVAEKDALLEQTTRDLAKARADLTRATPSRLPPPPKPAPSTELRALEQRLRDQTQSLDQAQKANKALETERATLQKKIDDAGARDQRANAEIHRLQSELAAARKTAADKKPTPAAAAADLKSLEHRLQYQAEALSQAQSANESLEGERTALRKQLEEVAAREREATSELARARDELALARKEALDAESEAARAQAVTEEALRAERQSGLEALGRAQREHQAEIAARDKTHAQDIVLATRAVAKLKTQLAEQDRARAALEQRLAEALEAGREKKTTPVDEEAATRWANERAVLEERIRMAEAHSDETAMTLVEAHAEVDALRRRVAKLEAEEPPTVAQVRALEASLVSRSEAMARLERELDEALREVPALEAEIVVLRSELVNLRRQLDTVVLHERTTDAQLERGRDLLERAEALVGRRADES